MTLLILGLLIWSGVHFIPSLAQPFKNQWKKALGDKGYQITFSLLAIISLVMIVFGWRGASPTFVYTPPDFVKPIVMFLMVVAFILFGASHRVTRIKKYVRHPQLSGVILWSFAHLLANGDSKSVVLFAGMGLWAIVEIFAINRREGEWQKSDVPAWSKEIQGIAISLVILVVVVFVHPYIAGVSLK